MICAGRIHSCRNAKWAQRSIGSSCIKQTQPKIDLRPPSYTRGNSSKDLLVVSIGSPLCAVAHAKFVRQSKRGKDDNTPMYCTAHTSAQSSDCVVTTALEDRAYTQHSHKFGQAPACCDITQQRFRRPVHHPPLRSRESSPRLEFVCEHPK